MATAFTPVSAIDTFSRTLSGDWGSTDNGITWSGEASYFSIGGSAGSISVPLNSSYRTAYLAIDSSGIPLQDRSSEILMICQSVGSRSDYGPMLNRSAAGTFYFASLDVANGEVSVGCYVDGTRHIIDVSSVSVVSGFWHYVRFQRTTNNLRVKVWRVGRAEPTSWTMETGIWSGSNPPGAGRPGIYTHGQPTNYFVYIDSFYFYTLEDSEPYLPVLDTFGRTVTQGFGSSDSNHTWYGNVSDDPNVLTNARAGSITPGLGVITLANQSVPYKGMIGPDTSGIIEAYYEWQTNSVSGTLPVEINLGLYGNSSYSSGVFQPWGYMLRYVGAGTTIQFYKRTAAGGSDTAVGASAAVTAVTANTTMKVRLQREGTALRARWWTGAVEPGTWNITTTDASITHGALWFEINNPSTTSTRTFTLIRAEYHQFTPTVGTDYTIPGTFTFAYPNDQTITPSISYTNDTNANNSLLLEYRESTDTTWITAVGPSVNRGTKVWSKLISFLTPGTTYVFRATFTDADQVIGTNPVIATTATTFNLSELDDVFVSNVTGTTADVFATYKLDQNNNAGANLTYRTIGQEIFDDTDTFTGTSNPRLHQHATNSSHLWAKHSLSASLPYVQLYRNRAVLRQVQSVGDVLLYTNNTPVVETTSYSVKAWFIWSDPRGNLSLATNANINVATLYHAGFYFDTSEGIGWWRIYKQVSGVTTLLSQSPSVAISQDQFYKVEYKRISGEHFLIVDGDEVCYASDNTITGGSTGVRFEATSLPTKDDPYYFGRMDNFSVSHPGTAGGGTAVAMTAYAAGAGPRPDLTHRYFHYPLTGLASDTLYEAKVTLTDLEGYTVGTSNIGYETFLTVGNKVAWSSNPFQSIVYPTSVTTIFTYVFDNNNNSTAAVQYKAANESIWTTLPTSNVIKDSVGKTFTATVTGLRSATTYEVRATLSDPDGIMYQASATTTGSATTKTLPRTDQQLNKRYNYKIFENSTGNYLESIKDAGVPEFTYEQNGGVSDLTVRLRRPISILNDPNTSIQFFNRIDIWVHDTFDAGLGPNLIEDESISLGSWTLGADTTVSGSGGVDGGKCLKISANNSTVRKSYSEVVYIDPSPNIKTDDFRNRTFILSVYAKAKLGKLVLSVEEYRDVETAQSLLAVGDQTIDTVGTEWQLLRIRHRIKDPRTEYIRIVVYNEGAGEMRVDSASVRCEEMLLYSGNIEQISPFITAEDEYIDVQILGDAARLSDTYVDWLQYVTVQGTDSFIIDPGSTDPPPNNRIYRPNEGAADPSIMLKGLIEVTNKDNPKSRIYYTAASIKSTDDEPREYTFKEKQIRASFDKVRSLSPSGWHYFIEPDGCVWLRGVQHTRTHVLRIGVEATKFEADYTIRNLKNYVYFKGRQDDDYSEPDGNGTILATAFDKKNIDLYGKRMIYERDAKVTDPETADAITQGRLDELDRPEQRSRLTVLDEKTIIANNTGFRGYNIESFRPGDMVIILNPRANPEYSYWDQAIWDQDVWDASLNVRVLTSAVPIKTIQYHDTHVILELSERAPSSVGDFGRMLRIIQKQEADGNE